MRRENIVVTNHLRRLAVYYKIFLFIGVITSLLRADDFYVCSKDQQYIDYKAGMVSNLEGATKYTTDLLCSYGCNKYSTCNSEPVANTINSPVFNCIDATQAQALQTYFSTKTFNNVTYKNLGVPAWNIDFGGLKSGSEFIFPYAFDAANNMTAWDHNGSVVKIQKDANNYVQIKMTIEGSAEHNVSNVIYKGDKKYTITGVINGVSSDISCGTFDMAGNLIPYENQFDLTTNSSLFYCPLRKSENIGGDYTSGSRFSNNITCNNACVLQNECIKVSSSPCKTIDILYSQPVTDYTGKTLYTKRSVSSECNSTITKTVGCAQWNVVANEGTIDVNMSTVGTIFKDRNDSSKEAGALASMLEQQLHVFSGWEGQCDRGKLFSNPFSDPFKLLSYAMLVYSSSAVKVTNDVYGAGATYEYPLGETMADLHNTFSNAASDFSSGWNDIVDQMPSFSFGATLPVETNSYVDGWASGLVDTTSVPLDSVAGTSGINNVKDMTNTIKDYITTPIHTIDLGFAQVEMYLTDYIQLGMSMIPTKQEMQTAHDFNMAWLGDENANDQSVAYATCMASIGLSYPNLISYMASDMNNTSASLSHPFDNPLRLSYSQIQYLTAATSDTYVKTMYFFIDNKPLQRYLTVVAKDAKSYFQAGQVICGGKISVASNAINVSKPVDSSSGNNIGEAVAMMAVKKALAMLPPPYNIMATVLVDLIMAFDSVNACTNIDDATKLGALQMKTNRFRNFDQCYYTRTSCQDKFLGKCILRREYQCCYDQISTRIFAEGIKEQLGLDKNNCNNITLEHLKNISFRKCLPSENAFTNHCFPANKWDEYQKALQAQGYTNFEAEKMIQTGINSLGFSSTMCKPTSN